tara:strand:- start:1144 stop:1368 length:225 start_codon:yes stop_codon:yes gene_type:complete
MIKEYNGNKLTPKQAAKDQMAIYINNIFYIDWQHEYPEATEREIALIEEQAEKLADRLLKQCQTSIAKRVAAQY